MAETTNIYLSRAGLRHDTGAGHPESAERLAALLALFEKPPFNALPRGTVREASEREICRAHTRAYFEKLCDAMPDRGYSALDGDTILSPDSYEAMMEAAGTVCQATEDVLAGQCQNAFCAVRPPGHHAFANHAEGFCLLNNAMIGALHARAIEKDARIAIVDFDVHHGNGTDKIARDHDYIFYASTHQGGIYPHSGTGEDDIAGRIINKVLKAGDGTDAFRAAWREEILPALAQFAPDVMIISAGFDAHRDDPLAAINLDDDDYRWITAELMKLAAQHSQGRIISVLEGGYDLGALTRGVAVHVETLSGV